MQRQKLSAWAAANGVRYETAWRWHRDGVLPIKSIQLQTGTILVEIDETPALNAVALYARVSSHDQSADLDRQLARLVEYATKEGLTPQRVVKEIGSGLNDSRPQLLKLLADDQIATIVVEHRDRLARFGVKMLEASLAANGRQLVVIAPDELDDDLVRDMIDVLTSFCARLYGRRSAQARARRALAAAGGEA